MRSLHPLHLMLVVQVALAGCAAERDSFEPIEPGSVARTAAKGDVRCSADENGNLRVRAPADARVTEDRTTDDAAVEIAYAADGEYPQMPRPRRPMSRSLGFIGDAPLTQGPSYGGRWSYGAHDDLLPPHAHRADFPGARSYGRSWGYRSYSYGFR